MTSDRPTLVRFVNDRNSSSNHVRERIGGDRNGERPRPDDLDRHERVGEGPGDHRERRRDRPQLIGGDEASRNM